jgi:hypothetical protein
MAINAVDTITKATKEHKYISYRLQASSFSLSCLAFNLLVGLFSMLADLLPTEYEEDLLLQRTFLEHCKLDPFSNLKSEIVIAIWNRKRRLQHYLKTVG